MASFNLKETALRTKAAAKRIASASTDEKNSALLRIAEAVLHSSDEILSQNELDRQRAIEKGISDALLDRLTLTEKRISDIAEGVRQLAALPDPVGEVLETITPPSGITVQRVRVPMGLIGMIYEARPNVTVDAAALALKAGSGIILRGSSSALYSNMCLVRIMQDAISEGGVLPRDAVSIVEDVSRDSVTELISMRGIVDLIVPRGGASLIRNVVDNAKAPVLETGTGNCHIYIDKDADIDMAIKVLINGKCQRPEVCNALETMLIHRDRLGELPRIGKALTEAGVTLHACPETISFLKGAYPAAEDEYDAEYLSLDLAVKAVGNIDEAISHIEKHGTGHTEVIITENQAAADKFLLEVDAACVNHNASSRFTDGFQFGFGAELGISTQKMHARGPMGLREITSYKYIVRGHGEIRG